MASTSLNYYSPLKPYSFAKELYIKDDNIILTYLTHYSGTFVIVQGDSILIKSKFDSHMPSQLLGIGCSVQFRESNNRFHEVSLTRLSFSQSDHETTYTGEDSQGNKFYAKSGYNEKTFVVGLRYELGQYFGNKKAPIRFGLSGSIEPTYFNYKNTPYSSADYPLNAKLLTLDLSLIPMLSFKFSKLVSVDFKFIPNFLVGDVGNLRRGDPLLPPSKQGGTRIYKSPDLTWASSVQLRYMIKQGKKKRAED